MDWIKAGQGIAILACQDDRLMRLHFYQLFACKSVAMVSLVNVQNEVQDYA
jgi:hypothetical protein